MHTTKPTAGQRSMERRMAPTEADRLHAAYRRMPHSAFYSLESEFSGKVRNIAPVDALYVLTVRGYLSAGEVAA